MKVAIFTEGGKRYGYGHISRSKALYQSFVENDITPELIINADETIAHLVEDVPYVLKDWINEWATKALKNKKEIDISIIDSYVATEEVYKKISWSSREAVFIDDTNRLDYPAGVLVNTGFGWQDLNYKKCIGIDYIFGPQYVYLRKEFWVVPAKLISKNINSVMITLGGTNIVHFIREIVDHIKKSCNKILIYVVFGSMFKKGSQITSIEKEGVDIFISPNSDDIKQLMAKSDVLISGGGQTILESLRMGLPTVVVGIADNQLPTIRALEKIKAIRFAGNIYDPKMLNNLTTHLKELSDNAIREDMSILGQKLIDGKGGERIVKQLIDKLSPNILENEHGAI